MKRFRRRSTALRLAGALALCATFAGCGQHARNDDASYASVAASPARKPVDVVVLGDSLGLGVGASDSSRGFTFDLYRRIAAERPHSRIRDFAIGGATVADVTRLEAPRLADVRADVVFVEAGGNDAVRRTTAGDFARDYAGLVRAVRARAPRARLVLFNVPDVAVSPIFEDANKPSLRRLVRAYDASVASVARSDDARVADLFDVSERARTDGDRFLSADLFHPSDVGYAAIANATWPVVRNVVEGIR